MSSPMMKYFPVRVGDHLEQDPHPKKPGKMCPRLHVLDDDGGQATDIFTCRHAEAVAVVSGEGWPNVPLGDSAKGWTYWDKGGWHFYLKGDDGFLYYYAHLESYPLIEPGQRVEAGRPVGYVGDTGNAKGLCPHLHFNIFKMTQDGRKGAAIQPFHLVKALEPQARSINVIEESEPSPWGWFLLVLAGVSKFFRR